MRSSEPLRYIKTNMRQSTRETFGFSEAGAAALGFVTLCLGALGMEGTTKG
jgi:hypothetical protein